MVDLINVEMLQSAHAKMGFDGQTYGLVFADELNAPGRGQAADILSG